MVIPQWVWWVGGGAGSVALGVLGNLLTPAIRSVGLNALQHLQASRLAVQAAEAEAVMTRPAPIYFDAAATGIAAAAGLICATIFLTVSVMVTPTNPVFFPASAGIFSMAALGVSAYLRLRALYATVQRPQASFDKAMERGKRIPAFDLLFIKARGELGLDELVPDLDESD